MDLTDELERSIPTGPAGSDRSRADRPAAPAPAAYDVAGGCRRCRARALAVTALVAGGVALLASPEQTPTATRPRASSTDPRDAAEDPVAHPGADHPVRPRRPGVLRHRREPSCAQEPGDPPRRQPSGVDAPAQTVGLRDPLAGPGVLDVRVGSGRRRQQRLGRESTTCRHRPPSSSGSPTRRPRTRCRTTTPVRHPRRGRDAHPDRRHGDGPGADHRRPRRHAAPRAAGRDRGRGRRRSPALRRCGGRPADLPVGPASTGPDLAGCTASLFEDWEPDVH